VKSLRFESIRTYSKAMWNSSLLHMAAYWMYVYLVVAD